MVNGRNRSVDAVKGILIFLVVIGHVLLGTLDENIIRYTIYSFHMPAFFLCQRLPSRYGKISRTGLLERFVQILEEDVGRVVSCMACIYCLCSQAWQL